MNLYESSKKDKAIAQANKWIAEKQLAPDVKEVCIVCAIRENGWMFYPASDIYVNQHRLEQDVVERIPVENIKRANPTPE